MSESLLRSWTEIRLPREGLRCITLLVSYSAKARDVSGPLFGTSWDVRGTSSRGINDESPLGTGSSCFAAADGTRWWVCWVSRRASFTGGLRLEVTVAFEAAASFPSFITRLGRAEAEPLLNALRKPLFFSPDEFVVVLDGAMSPFVLLDNNLDIDCIDCCFLRRWSVLLEEVSDARILGRFWFAIVSVFFLGGDNGG